MGEIASIRQINMPSPIVLFVYKRPDLTLKTLSALQNNDLAPSSKLFIFADGPKTNSSENDLKDIERTRRIIKERTWCKESVIIENDHNLGLAKSVISGVTEVLRDFDRIIVLEDDLVTAKGFLRYMNTGLDRYSDENRVMQLSGYNFPFKAKARGRSYFMPFTASWGWGTWKRAWDSFDEMATGYEELKSDSLLRDRFNLEGSYPYSDMMYNQMEKKIIDSWAVRWWWSVFKQNGLVLYPDVTLIQNIGFGEGATHTNSTVDFFNTDKFLSSYAINFFPDELTVNEKAFSKVQEFISTKMNFRPSRNRNAFRNLVDKFRAL